MTRTAERMWTVMEFRGEDFVLLGVFTLESDAQAWAAGVERPIVMQVSADYVGDFLVRQRLASLGHTVTIKVSQQYGLRYETHQLLGWLRIIVRQWADALRVYACRRAR